MSNSLPKVLDRSIMRNHQYHPCDELTMFLTGQCKDSLTPSIEPTSEAKGMAVWPIIFPVVLVLLAIFLVTCFCRRKKGKEE